MNDSPGTLHVSSRIGALDPTWGAWGERLLSSPLVGGPGDAENIDHKILCMSLLQNLTRPVFVGFAGKCFHQQHPTF